MKPCICLQMLSVWTDRGLPYTQRPNTVWGIATNDSTTNNLIMLHSIYIEPRFASDGVIKKSSQLGYFHISIYYINVVDCTDYQNSHIGNCKHHKTKIHVTWNPHSAPAPFSLVKRDGMIRALFTGAIFVPLMAVAMVRAFPGWGNE